MSAIGPGDLVVKVAGPCTVIPRGKILRVDDLCWHGPEDCDPYTFGLVFDAYRSRGPDTCECYDANNFRKLNDGTDDAELIERIKNCKPVRERQPA